MKKSEELFQAAASEDNDLVAMGLRKKAIRQRNAEEAEEFIKQFEPKYRVITDDPSKYSIVHDNLGIIDWYPKANRVLIRKYNKWIDFGRDWLKKNL